MSLFPFTKKKVEEDKEELRPLSLKFPEFSAEVPKYDEEMSPAEMGTIKEAISSDESLGIPVRKPMFTNQTEETFDSGERKEKTLFIKMDNYKEAIVLMNKIKEKMQEAEKIAEKLNQIKEEEDNELSSWHQNLEEIKEGLLSIDKELFEH